MTIHRFLVSIWVQFVWLVPTCGFVLWGNNPTSAVKQHPIATTTTKRPRPTQHVPQRSTALSAHYLTSALESLAEQKGILSNENWLPANLTSLSQQQQENANNLDQQDNDESLVVQESSMPLYPLPAVYLPTGDSVTYTLQNIEPRNIQMAMDLAQTSSSPQQRYFCATLRTLDTGRLAQTGTLMRIVDMEAQSVQDGQIQKIVLQCVADQVVEIVHLDNLEATDLAYRLQRPKEYLKARIRRRPVTSTGDDNTNDEMVESLASQIAQDFNRVRKYLMEGYGMEDLPPFARQNLADALPPLEASNLLSDGSSFWKAAYTWQTYAHTLREGYQQRLASDRNELLIAGALKHGGPLNLPVHLTDLLPEDREQVVRLEQDLQNEWVATGLEPLLDFQALLVATTHLERLERLADMVAREKDRLTMVALTPLPAKEVEPAEAQVVRKGAWFEDDW